MALTDEDKNWIGAQLQRLDTKIERLDTKIDRVETSLKAEIERVETSLLTAFHKWASPMEMKQRSHSSMIHALELEVQALDERVKKLEPPAA